MGGRKVVHRVKTIVPEYRVKLEDGQGNSWVGYYFYLCQNPDEWTMGETVRLIDDGEEHLCEVIDWTGAVQPDGTRQIVVKTIASVSI